MRGRLERGWLLTPRIWWSRLARQVERWSERREQYERRTQAARSPTRSGWWHLTRTTWLVIIVVSVLVVVVTCTEFVIPMGYLLVNRWRDIAHHGWNWPESINPCAGAAPQCRAIAAFATPVTTAALVFAAFTVKAYLRMVRWYNGVAGQRPHDLVVTADPTVDHVVGRQELCEVLIERIRDPVVRCPVVLVGGVGSGKTATLVALTGMLARRRIVPVPIRMHDAQDGEDLDFEALARATFLRRVGTRLGADANGDRLWRALRRWNRVAVLADGLEEAVKSEKAAAGESVIRTAIARATEDGLPLIIASRPYDPLRGMSGIVIGLEPLGEGAALEYALGADGTRLIPGSAWGSVVDLVDAADVTESPLYLKIVRDLNAQHLLPSRSGPTEPRTVTRPSDRQAVRLELLDAWREALLDGYLVEDFARSRRERESTLSVLAALACAGFLHNSLHVTQEALTDDGDWQQPTSPQYELFRLLQRRLKGALDARERDDLAAAMTEGDELSVVDEQRNGVRFQHGAIQAYLGTDLLEDARLRQGLLPVLVTRRSRELLMALALLSRRFAGRDYRDPRVQWLGTFSRPFSDPVKHLVDTLLARVRDEPNQCWKLELYAAALEIDTCARKPAHRDIVQEIEWHCRASQDKAAPDRPLDEAKLQLVRRIGDAARLITDRRRHPSASAKPPTMASPYHSFFRLACGEPSYRVRLAAARELGLGGRDAALELARIDALGPGPVSVAGRGGPDADQAVSRERQVRGWISVLLWLSSMRDEVPDETDHAVDLAHEGLRDWLHTLARSDPADPAPGFGITSEIALAQGFRLAANVRRLPMGRQHWDRSFLIEKAEQALRHSRFWYSHLILVQALTLLSLPDDPMEPLPRRGAGADPYALVQHWLRTAGSAVPGVEPCTAHPFLLEVGRLCRLALLSRRPERYVWIDEQETASRVGSCSPRDDIRREQSLWVPDSMGWAVLSRRAQRLLGDVMLLLNLADRGPLLVDREERLARAARCDLPPCLTNDRRALGADRNLNTDDHCEPGATCLDDCRFRLCPLPARGESMAHQLDDNFCARQADLTHFWSVLRTWAPWQHVPRPELERFWRQMSERHLPGWRRRG